MLLVGVYIMRLAATSQWLEKLGKALIWQHLAKLNRYLLPVDTTPKALLYGALWGWLPCGLVYSALTHALTSPSASSRCRCNVVFALGNLSAMISVGLVSQKINTIFNHVWIRVILGSVIIWYVYTLLIIATDKVNSLTKVTAYLNGFDMAWTSHKTSQKAYAQLAVIIAVSASYVCHFH